MEIKRHRIIDKEKFKTVQNGSKLNKPISFTQDE